MQQTPTATAPTAAEGAVRGPTPGTRLLSLDAFRGLTIAAMILVNSPGSWSHVYAPLLHAEWHGWTPTDLIFPYFLFILGVALPFSFRRRIAEGASRARLFRHVLRRALILIALGTAMRVIPDFDLAGMRWPGVLQRIGLVYLAAGALYLWVGTRARIGWTAGILLGYWGALTLVSVPGYGAGDLTPVGNLAAYVDRLLMNGHLYQGTWDPEGLLSTAPAVATALLGITTGEWLLSGRDPRALTRDMLVAGAGLMLVGLAWGSMFPINKNLWTSSYVLFTGGTALLLLAFFHEVVDVRLHRGPWLTPLLVYGMNAIAVFVASGFLTKALVRIQMGEGGPSLYAWTYETLFRSWAGDKPGSLAFAVTYVLLWLGLTWLLHRKRIFIKI